jgi:hypothetical protein
LGSDTAADQYPTVAVCVECIAQEESRGENSRIVSVGERVSGSHAECEFCGRDEDEE